MSPAIITAVQTPTPVNGAGGSTHTVLTSIASSTPQQEVSMSSTSTRSAADGRDTRDIPSRDAAPRKQMRLRFSSIKCGHSHAVAVDHNGSVWSWGCNAHGQVAGDVHDHVLCPRRIPLGHLMHATDRYAVLRCGTIAP